LVPARTILLVDDSDGVRLTVTAFLEDLGHHVVCAGSLAEGRDRLGAASFDVALVDLHLPDGLGTALLAELRGRHPTVARVLLTGADAAGPIDGVDLVVEKGLDPEDLGAMVERAIAAHR
jgi:CheY-like chemotaxis protein